MFTRVLILVLIGLAFGSSQVKAQIEFPTTRASDIEIRRRIESIDNFLYTRSNIRLSDTIKSRLVAAERQVALGANSRLTAAQLIDVLTEIALKRLQSLTADDIQRAKTTYEKSYVVDNSYSGFTWKQIKMSPADFEKNLRRLSEHSRSNNKELLSALQKVIAGSSPESGVNGQLRLYARVLPDQFGEAMQAGISPTQALMIAYAIASDDPIHISLSALENEMAQAHKNIGGQRYPEPNGSCPFGANGYLFATPLDLMFNDETIESMLDCIQIRTKI